MKNSIALTAMLAAGGLAALDRRGCDANDCARAVTGTARQSPPLTSRQALCSSFLLTTVYPATVTVTTTLTFSTSTTVVVTTSVPPVPMEKRAPAGPVTVTPSVVPPYASSCPDASAYSSACSCWGIAGQTTTMPTPTSTVTTSTTITSTITSVVTATTIAIPFENCAYTVGFDAGGCSNPTYTCSYPQADDDGGICYCDVDVTGQPFCAGNFDCGDPNDQACSSNSDCGVGFRCVQGCGCGPGNVCEPEVPNGCGTSSKRRGLLARGKGDCGKNNC